VSAPPREWGNKNPADHAGFVNNLKPDINGRFFMFVKTRSKASSTFMQPTKKKADPIPDWPFYI
jgi:hypothetical protein